METKEWIIFMSILIPFFVLLYSLGSKWIDKWSENEKTRNKEHIEAVVDLRFETKLEEMKKNYAEMIQLIRNGTFK